MNDTQRMLIVAALIVIGMVLMFAILDWGDVDRQNHARILAFYTVQNRYIASAKDDIGISTPFGVTGILLGIIAPLCLWAAAAFVHLGGRKER